MSNKVKVAFIQQQNTANCQQNMQKSIQGIYAAASKGANLIVLQELHRSLYFCQTEDVDLFDLAETIPGPSTKCFSEIA